MKVNGESIYGTHASPFKKLTWGRCTAKPSGDDTILYLQVLELARRRETHRAGPSQPLKSAELLAGGAKATVEKSENGPVLTIPATAPDPICSTIKVTIKGKPEVGETLGFRRTKTE